jgi:hypothetical protein
LPLVPKASALFTTYPTPPYAKTKADLTKLQISDALRRFGLTDKTTSLLAIRIIDTTLPPYSPTDSHSPTSDPIQPQHNTLELIRQFLTQAVEGTSVPFSDEEIAKVRDIASIRKAYKLPAPAVKKAVKIGQVNGSLGTEKEKHKQEMEEREMKELEINVLGIMAIKGS